MTEPGHEQPARQQAEPATAAPPRGLLRRAFARVLLVLGKFSRLIYILVLTLVVILGWFLLTTSGAQWLAERAMDEEPRLSLTVKSGSLLNGLKLEAVSWHDGDVVVAVDSADARWNLLCLMQLQVCLNRLHVDGVSVSLRTDGEEPAEAGPAVTDDDAGDEEPFSLPVTAKFPDIRLSDVELAIDGQTVRWDSVELAGALGRERLRIDRLHTRAIDVRIPDMPAPQQTAGAGESAQGEQTATEGLPLPFAISMLDVRLVDTRVDLAGDVQELARLDLALELSREQIHLQRLVTDGLTVRIPDGLLDAAEDEFGAFAEAPDDAETAGPADSPDEPFALPFALLLEHVELNDTRIFLDGTRQSLGLLRLSAGLGDDGLVVRELRTEDLTLNPPAWLLEAGETMDTAADPEPLARADSDEQQQPLLPESIDLPFPVSVHDFTMLRSRVLLQGNEQRLGVFRLRLDLDESAMQVHHLHLEDGRLVLAEPTPDAVADDEPVITADGELDLVALLDPSLREALKLPEIVLPLDVSVEDVAIRDIAMEMGDELHQLDVLDLSLHGSQSAVRLNLAVDMPELRLRLDSEADLRGNYPLALDLSLDLDAIPGLAEVDPVSLTLALDGDLADLGIDLSLTGALAVNLSGRVNAVDPAHPVDLELRWEELAWPLDGEPMVATERGQLTLRGDLNAMELGTDLALEGPDIPASRWQLRADADYRGVDGLSLQADVLGGTLALTGSAGWDQGYHWDLALDWADLNPAQLVDGAPETLSGLLRTEGSLVGEDLRLDAELVRLRTELEGQVLQARGRVSHRSGDDWEIHRFRADAADGFVELSGRVGEQLDIAGELDLPALDVLLADLRGQVAGTFRARGPLETPDIDLDLSASGVGWAELATLERLNLRARVRSLGEQDSELRLDLSGLELPEQDITVGNVALLLDGRQDNHRLRLDVTDSPAELALALSGALGSDMAWNGSLESATISAVDLALTLEQAVGIRWDPSREQALVEAHCWRHASARLCAEERLELGVRGQANIRLSGYDMADLEPWLPEGVATDGTLGLALDVSWTDDGALPLVDARFEISDGRVRFEADLDDGLDPESQELRYREFSMALTLDRDQLRSALVLDSEDFGQARVRALIDVDNAGELGALDGEVSLRELNLAVLEPFFLELRTLRGEITASGQLSGHTRDPRFNGELQLVDGLVETVAVPVTLSDIALQVDVRETRADISGGFRSGEGRAEISGGADWSGEEWRVDVRLRGERLDVAYDTIAQLKASPDLRFQMRPQAVRLSGSIEIPEGDITIRELPASAVRVSGDVVIVDDELDFETEALPEEGDPIPVAEGWAVTTDIEILLGNRIHLEGFGLTGRLTGNLGIRQSGIGAPQGNGEINILDGQYRAYGQRLQIRRGQFVFAGPLDRPRILVEAVRDVSRYDVIAGLRVEGDPDSPQASLFSEPGLPEEEILSYLLLGRPPGQGGEGDDVMVRAALALGMAGGAGTATAIAEGLGVQDFQIDTAGDGDDTQVTVGGYIGPNLFLSYGVGVFVPVNALTLRYELTNNLYLEAVSSIENALDLFYTFRF